MFYQDRFDPNLKITFNGDEYTCSRRRVLKLSTNQDWQEIPFTTIKRGNTIRLRDPDGTLVNHEDGRHTFIAKSDAKVDELGLLCFEI